MSETTKIQEAEIVQSSDKIESAISLPRAAESMSTWLHQFVETRLNAVFSMDEDGVPQVRPDAPAEQIGIVARQLYQMTAINEMSSTAVKFMLGRLVLEAAARNGTDKMDAIELLGLEDATSKSAGTINAWTSAAQHFYGLPAAELILPISFYTTAISYRAPSDPEAASTFVRRRNEIIEQAAANPSDWTKRRIGSELRALQDASGVKRTGSSSTTSVVRRIVHIQFYLANATDEQMKAKGIQKNYLESIRDDLLEKLADRGYIQSTDFSDPKSYINPWEV